VTGFRSRLVACLAAAGFASAIATIATAQPQVPSTVYGSVAVDGKPVPDGTEIRGFVDGLDCTQLGPTYRGTITDGGVSVFLINVVHETQKPGCGKPGKIVTFTIGARTAVQSALWQQGPQQLNLSAGQGEPPALPTPTPTRPLAPTEAAATATEQAKFTPKPAGTLPTDEVQIVTGTRAVGADPGVIPPAAGKGESFPVVYVLLIVLAAIVLTGTAAGVALGRRGAPHRGDPPQPPAGGGPGES
jgi:hypothetical protein